MKIVFFDGHCSLCNSTVDWMIRHDRRGELEFASLQGETAKRVIPAHAGAADYDTVVYSREGVIYERSTAVLRAIGDMGGFWVIANVMLYLPRVLRDLFYRLVARNRFRLFGRRDTCRMPSPEERGRLLP
jgi:predicted DCC family thiol-disulfide oxidoreductase YuxK